MARDHARVKTSIWEDADFLGLKVAEQHLYLALMSNKGLSRVGVVDYIPNRFDHLAIDLTAAKFSRAIAGLCESRFVVLDERTQELLLRSYVRHDGVLDRVNMGKAVGTAFEAVVSARIKRAIGDELARIMREDPSLAGWMGLGDTSPKAHAMACRMESSIR